MTSPVTEAQQTGDLICYVYAVGREGEALEEAASDVRGQGGTRVRTVTLDGLAALVSTVPAEQYDEEGMKRQLEDMEQLETLARTHDAVVATAYRHATVLPMRLATVYLDDARVGAMLRERGEELRGLLARLEGRLELGVKVYADPAQSAGPEPEPGDAGTGEAAGPGRAYLQRRRASRSRHQEVYRSAGHVASRAAELAAELAEGHVQHRPQQGELAVGTGENISNEAYLVPAEYIDEFRTTVTALAEDTPGVRLEVTGPWAPYSFASPPQHAGGAADAR